MGIVGAFAAAPARSGGATMANTNADVAGRATGRNAKAGERQRLWGVCDRATQLHTFTRVRGRQLGARREGIRSA